MDANYSDETEMDAETLSALQAHSEGEAYNWLHEDYPGQLIDGGDAEWTADDEAAYQRICKASDQGAADFENRAGQHPLRAGDDWQAYIRGWNDAADYASEASLRRAESGEAYEAYLDARATMSMGYREAEWEQAMDDLYREVTEPALDPERHFVRDAFMARVLAYGEEAERQADAAWAAGAAERRAADAAARQAWKDAIPF